MASTHSNKFSSRSHAIIQISMERTQSTTQDTPVQDSETSSIFSKLTLVDLAGSEKEDQEDCVQNKHRLEGSNINKSLLALGNCIKTLSQKKSKGRNKSIHSKFVPYRDSKLTRLLKDSLGGNTKTLMLACVSPSYAHYEETLNTLKYAARARKIQNPAKRNIKAEKKSIAKVKKLIGELKLEIISIKSEIEKAKNSEEVEHSPSIMHSGRRNSFIQPNNYDFNSDDLLEVLSYSKSASFEKSRLKNLKKFLKHEMAQLMVKCEAVQPQGGDSPEIDQKFQDLVVSIKDRVRLTQNQKEITEALRIQSTEEGDSYSVDLENLLAKNETELGENLTQTENLVETLKELKDGKGYKKDQQNIEYYDHKVVELKRENLDMREYLGNMKTKYLTEEGFGSDDTEMQELEQQKEQLRAMIAERNKENSDMQTNIKIIDSDLRDARKKAAGKINSLVIHFQTEALSQMKEKIDQLKEEQVRRSILQQKMPEPQSPEQEIEILQNSPSKSSSPQKSLSSPSIQKSPSVHVSPSDPPKSAKSPQSPQQENPFEITPNPELSPSPPSSALRKESTPLKLKGSFLEHEQNADLHQDHIQTLQEEKQIYEAELLKVKEREEQNLNIRQELEQELLRIKQVKIDEEEQIRKDTEQLEQLRQMREKMQKEHEDQIKLQNEIEAQILEEKKRKQELQDLADKHIMTNYLKEMSVDEDFFKGENSSKQSVVSRHSKTLSNSEDYSSFMNDIRTVYELQDEESKFSRESMAMTQNDLQTVIQKPTPVPQSDSNESFDREGEDLMVLHERNSYEDNQGLEKTLSNICPSFPINFVTKPNQRSPKVSEMNDSKISNPVVLNNSFKRARISSIHQSGKSFGSKCYSRKVSPKAHTVNLENSDFGSFSSDSPKRELKKTQKEIIIENLNSFSSKSGDSISEKEKYLVISPANELKVTYLSENQPRTMAKQKNFSEVNLLAPGLMSTLERKEFSPVFSGRETSKVSNVYQPLSTLQTLPRQSKNPGEAQIRSFQDPDLANSSTVLGHAKTNPKVKKSKKSGKSRKGRKKTKTRSKKFRDLSFGNQFKYKGKAGFALIRKYRSKRRIESLKQRENSLGQRNMVTSSRSRNRSEDGFFETFKSQSSD